MASPCSHELIAIVGTGHRFPGGANNASKLWELLLRPRDLLRRVPPERRWKAEAFFHDEAEHHGTSNVQSAYFLDEDPADLDNNFFNIQPAEAEAIDPQQRMLLEVVFESLVDGGHSVEALRGSDTAVIVGAMTDDWSLALNKDWETLPQYGATGMGRSIMSNRLSYFFDWHGASITLDTACSSSLVAVHLGIQAIRNGESRIAVAAGTNLILNPAMYLTESNLNMVSSSGRCKMWNKDVDGYGRGEGVAAIVMKSLKAALEDGDNIQGIIRGTGLNQDGKTPGMTMPNPVAQAELIRETYARAGLDIDKLEDRPQFFHAHGTGTPAGDPREAEAISRAFYSKDAKDKLYVGSIKTIFGHTEGTAGLASLIGSMLALKHGVIPPNMHFSSTDLNPAVAQFYDHLEVPTMATPWPPLSPGQPRRVSVNSFGFGGTNAHAILESYEPELAAETSPGPSFTPLTISAASETSLRELLSAYCSYLRANPGISLANFAYTLQERRSTLAYRVAFPANSVEDAVGKMMAMLENRAEVPGLRERHFDIARPRILGVFTGQGAQWPRMGARLIEASPIASRQIDELDGYLAELPREHRPDWTLRGQLCAEPGSSKVYQAYVSQPLCTAVQILLINLLGLAGVKLNAVVGHSSGEIAAAYAAGLLTAREAIITAYYRGYYTKLAASPSGAKGAMVAVGTSLEDATSLCELEEFQGRIEIAAQNSPSNVTLTGDEDAVDEAIKIFEDEGKFARKLRVDTAYHSLHMRPCAAPYLASMRACGIGECPATTEGSEGSEGSEERPIWYSTVHAGKIITRAGKVDAQYWVDNMTNPVWFAPAIASLVRENHPFDLVLEIGPHPALKGPAMDTLQDASGGTEMGIPYSGLLFRGRDDVNEFAAALGMVWSTLGPRSVSFESFEQAVSGQRRRFVAGVPNYPWDHSRKFWKLSRLSGFHLNLKDPVNPLLGRRCVDRETSDRIQWRNLLQPKEIKWLKGHQVQNQILFPASGYVSMAVEAVVAFAGTPDLSLIQIDDFVIDRGIPFVDEDFVIESLFILDLDQPQKAAVDGGSIKGRFSLYCGNPFDGSRPMTLHARGKIAATLGHSEPHTLPFTSCMGDEKYGMVSIDVDRFYGQFESVQYRYSAPFNAITSVSRRAGLAAGTLADLAGSDWEDRLLIHPAMLDCAFQSGFAAWCCPGDGGFWTTYAPTRIQSITINPFFTSKDHSSKKTGASFPWETFLRHGGEGKMAADTTVLSPDSAHVFIQVQGLEAPPLTQPTAEDDLPLFTHFDYRIDGPDGAVAAIDDPPVPLSDDAVEMERLALFYLVRLTRTITQAERDGTLPHYQHLLRWADHVVETVRKGNHPLLQPDCLDDTEERFERYIEEHNDQVDVQLMRSVGDNLPSVVRSRSSILEYMTKDGMLDRIYAEGLGLDQPNRYTARMVAQIGHRYPRMNVFEIGAGTGGVTRYILPVLGDAFSTYTYTDVSSAFFEAAKNRFEHYNSRMVYKTYNMEVSPETQGFVGGAFDVVVASHTLHATDQLEEMMRGVRWLLRPGGYLVIQELVNNDVLRINLPMCGLPGWWVGANTTRPWGPALSLGQWDALLRATGFSGIDTTSPLCPAATVFASQAVNEQVRLLREPTQSIASLPPAPTSQLIVVGGKTAAVRQLVSDVADLMKTRYEKLARVEAFEDLAKLRSVIAQSTVVVACELDEPLMADPTPEKHEALQVLWRDASIVIWISEGARDSNPHAFMTVGLGRCIQYEYPNITLQRIDVDGLDAGTPHVLGSELLRLESLTAWNKQMQQEQQRLLWSVEPEIYFQHGRRTIPRLYPSRDANDRYNSLRRPITRDFNPQEWALLVNGSSSPSSSLPHELHCASPLRLPTAPSQAVAGTTKTLRVSHFLLRTLDVVGRSTSRLFLCAGFDQATGEEIVALSRMASASCACVLADWTAPLSSLGQQHLDTADLLVSLAAQIMVQSIFKLVPGGGTLVVHEPDERLVVALQQHARAQAHAPGQGFVVVVTTSVEANAAQKGWRYIHGESPRWNISRLLPAAPSAFLDLAPLSMPASSKAGKRIAECLPSSSVCYDAGAVLGSETSLRPDMGIHLVTEAFRAACAAVAKEPTNSAVDLGPSAASAAIPLSDLSLHPASVYWGEHLAVVECSSQGSQGSQGGLVPAIVRPIDKGVIFQPDKTYCLFGIANEVGQSLCRWMIKHGARHIVMTSRRPNVHPRFIEAQKALGATLMVRSCDMTDRESLHKCHDEIRQSMPPIVGVVHGAMVLRDSLFDSMAFEDLVTVLDPKVKGAQLLDELFYTTPLDFFVVMSSITTVVGNSGQSNYTCANMYMIALMAQRKRRGFAGSAMSMTALIGLGFVERSDELDDQHFSKLGYKTMSETDLHRQFAEAVLIGQPASNITYPEVASGLVPLYADEIKSKGRWRADVRFSHLVLERPGRPQGLAGQEAECSVRAKLAGAKSTQELTAIIKEALTARLKRIMMVSDDHQVNEKAPLVGQGIDSLMAVAIRTWFLKELEVDAPVLKILSGGSILDLATFGCENLPKHIIQELASCEGLADSVSAPNTSQSADLTFPGSNEPSLPTVSTPSSETNDGFARTPSNEPADGTEGSEPPALLSRSASPVAKPAHHVQGRMSFGQERFWFLNSYLDDEKTFNMATMFKLTGNLDLERLDEAVQTVVRRHEALRTRYFWAPEGEEGGGNNAVGMQGVWDPSHDSKPLPVRLLSKQIRSENDAAEELEKLHQHRWDLDSCEALKIAVLSLSDSVHYVLSGAHHISLDGFSFNLFFVELEHAYSGRALTPIGPDAQPRFFAAEQRARFEREITDGALDYYRGMISPELKPLPLLPFANCRTRPVLDRYELVGAKATLQPPLVSQLKRMARENNSTSFHLYLTALQSLLFRLLPDTEELFIGIADANRMEQKYMFSLGFFLNLLPMRFTRADGPPISISQAMQDTRDKAYAALQHSEIPFDVLLNQLQVPRSNTYTPIFQVFVDYRQVHQDRAVWGGCQLSDERWCDSRVGYDIALEITENPSGESVLSLRLQEVLYSQESAELLLRSFVNVLEIFAAATPAMTVDQVPRWHPDDIERALSVGKGPDLELRWPSTVSHRVDEMIQTHSHRPALKDGLGNDWTYAEMGARIDTIAAALQSAGAGPDQVVAVFQDPTADWICSLLAILRVGATYVPLDLRNSVARLSTIVNSAKPVLIVTDASTASKTKLIGAEQLREVNVSDLSQNVNNKPASSRPPNLARPDSTAIVLFTSGSTGKPKGVVIKHSNLRAECEAYSSFCDLPSMNAMVLQQSIFSFDFSIEQTFAALADGGCLYVVPADKRGDPREIASLMAAHGVTYTSGTPSEYELLFKHARGTLAECTSWRCAFGGGEYMSPGLVREFAGLRLPNLRLFNNYGPVEVTTAAVKGEIKYDDPAQVEEHTMAGYILPNYKLYFVDQDLKLVPVGVPGEIIVGGPGVTAGYLGRDDLTSQQYISNKFDKGLGGKGRSGDKLSRTGDVGRLRDDGAVYWEGRIEGDTQVKIRGFRVELAEVEAALVSHSAGAISHAVVTLRGDGEQKFLAAHVLFATDYPAEGRQHLIESLETTLPLPQYMRPSVVVPLAEKPLTAHSKLDRRAIQAMPLPCVEHGEDQQASLGSSPLLSEQQQAVAELWEKVVPHGLVNRRSFTPETAFFNVGGNSLLLVHLQALAKEAFGASPRLIDLMNAATLAEMTAVITASARLPSRTTTSIDWETETSVPKSIRQSALANRQPAGNCLTPMGKHPDGLITVVLAGATGHLGRHLLAALSENPRIREVICLVRDASKLAIVTGQQPGSPSRVSWVIADLAKPTSADTVVDCAADRAFWDYYEALKSVNVDAVKSLLRLLAGVRGGGGNVLTATPSFHFLSSGAVSLDKGSEPDPDGADGYVASKWAAETFLQRASQCLNGAVQINIHRPLPLRDDQVTHAEQQTTTDSNTAAATETILRTLLSLTHALRIRPEFGSVASGYLDLAPITDVASTIVSNILANDDVSAEQSTDGVRFFSHKGQVRVHLEELARVMDADEGLTALRPVNALDWFGEIKKAGFDYFITSHHLVMRHGGEEISSRR